MKREEFVSKPILTIKCSECNFGKGGCQCSGETGFIKFGICKEPFVSAHGDLLAIAPNEMISLGQGVYHNKQLIGHVISVDHTFENGKAPMVRVQMALERGGTLELNPESSSLKVLGIHF